MNPSLKRASLLVAVLATATAIALFAQAQTAPPAPAQSPPAQPPAQSSPLNRTLILLDPAHGGPDSGATLSDRVLEKDVTLALAIRLRAALVNAGFVVGTTRDADPTILLPADQRAEIANRAHPFACIVLHATATGSGVHLYASTLQPTDPEPSTTQPGISEDAPSTFFPVPWEMAQAASVRSSLALQSTLTSAFNQASLPTLAGRAPLRPLDNLMCPAIAIELAPLLVPGSDPTPVTNPDYQQRIASTLALALHDMRAHASPPGATPVAAKGPAR